MYWYIVGTCRPAAAAISRIVALAKPLRAMMSQAASTICCRRISATGRRAALLARIGGPVHLGRRSSVHFLRDGDWRLPRQPRLDDGAGLRHHRDQGPGRVVEGDLPDHRPAAGMKRDRLTGHQGRAAIHQHGGLDLRGRRALAGRQLQRGPDGSELAGEADERTGMHAALHQRCRRNPHLAGDPLGPPERDGDAMVLGIAALERGAPHGSRFHPLSLHY